MQANIDAPRPTPPKDAAEFLTWSWSQVEPLLQALERQSLNEANIAEWLGAWSHLSALKIESLARLNVARTVDTSDLEAERSYFEFLEQIVPGFEAAEDRLRRKLLASQLVPAEMAVPIRKMRADVGIFSDKNLPLLTEERKVSAAYDRIIGAQSVDWQGETLTLAQLKPLLQTQVRRTREQIWTSASQRELADRSVIDERWIELLALRRRIAENAGFDNYRSYRWKFLHRFDYTPDDCLRFHRSIEEIVVPAATRVYDAMKRELGVDTLRPWDVTADVYPLSLPALTPYLEESHLGERASAIFRQVDSQLADYFDIMRRDGLLDLFNRRGKAAGGYCTAYPVARRPFIFMNAVGTSDDVRTIIHEAGHAFHVFESSNLPYVSQRRAGSEFAEVASMGMELLSAPYLAREKGGYYSVEDAKRHTINHLRKIITFWPYMAVVDAFQHWVYQNPALAMDPSNCDARWSSLWHRFVPAVDFSGFEMEMATGWQRKLHIFRYPFYYVEYGMAQLGAIQIWRNAMEDQAGAIARYRGALALGGTRSLPELYSAAGASFSFDHGATREATDLLESTLDSLATG